MSGRKKIEIQEDISPNLIPMIDIMFLLLLFFMLGADMGHRELEEVMLPKAWSIKEDKEMKGEKLDRLTINIYHRYPNEVQCPAYLSGRICREEGHWRIGIGGKDFSDPPRLETRLKEEADLFRTDANDSRSMSDRRIMIRADAASPYGHVKDVMNLCAKVGIYQIECGAARPGDKAVAGG
jgi:biopolymer transport protein ExbD